MNLQLTILSSLRLVHPLMMPLGTLWEDVRRALVPEPSRSDFSHALRVLEDEKRQILVLRDDDRVRVKITAEGIARHEESHS